MILLKAKVTDMGDFLEWWSGPGFASSLGGLIVSALVLGFIILLVVHGIARLLGRRGPFSRG